MAELKLSKSLVDNLVEKLEVAIFRGDFPPGARLREGRLANELGVGRGQVREAVRRLEGRRLVVRTRNLGTSVTRLDENELLELLELREILEVAACRMASVRISTEELAALRDMQAHQIELSEKALPSLDEWQNQDFHYHLAQASKNRHLIELLCGDLWFLMRPYRYPGVLSPGRLPDGSAAHEAILQALEQRDPDLCEQRMKEHQQRFRLALAARRAGDAKAAR